jgi:tripeptidyl-peptidase-1
LHSHRLSRSDPDSAKYGQHYTPEQIHDLFAPRQDSVDAVKGWLTDAGIEPSRITQSVNKQWIQFDASVWEAESLLQTKYHFYEHAPTGKSTLGCDEYVYIRWEAPVALS